MFCVGAMVTILEWLRSRGNLLIRSMRMFPPPPHHASIFIGEVLCYVSESDELCLLRFTDGALADVPEKVRLPFCSCQYISSLRFCASKDNALTEFYHCATRRFLAPTRTLWSVINHLMVGGSTEVGFLHDSKRPSSCPYETRVWFVPIRGRYIYGWHTFERTVTLILFLIKGRPRARMVP